MAEGAGSSSELPSTSAEVENASGEEGQGEESSTSEEVSFRSLVRLPPPPYWLFPNSSSTLPEMLAAAPL